MKWTDRHGHALPLEEIFARQLNETKRRLGGTMTRVLQHRQRMHANEEHAVLHVRDGQQTRVFEDQEAP